MKNVLLRLISIRFPIDWLMIYKWHFQKNSLYSTTTKYTSLQNKYLQTFSHRNVNTWLKAWIWLFLFIFMEIWSVKRPIRIKLHVQGSYIHRNLHLTTYSLHFMTFFSWQCGYGIVHIFVKLHLGQKRYLTFKFHSV